MLPNPLARGLFCGLLMATGAPAIAIAAEPEPVQVVLPSGVRYVDLKPGTGDEAREGKILEVHYTGWLKDGGTKFDSTQDCTQPLTLRLGAGDVIKGLDEGLVGMKVGGKRRLTIPPELGFGKEGGGERIPPDATLVYEVELLAVR
jgi:FKBP-type peptidyl-prolyl cis-trans isomerase